MGENHVWPHRGLGSSASSFDKQPQILFSISSLTTTSPMGTLEKMEEYIHSFEELIVSSWSSAELPNVSETVNQLWLDITRYGPSMPNMPNVHIPGLGDFEIPPPVRPVAPPPTRYERALSWAEDHPWKAGAVLGGIAGTGIMAVYGGVYLRAMKARRLKAAASERRQVVGESYNLHLMV